MGNTMEVKLKEDKAVLEVTETLVGEFKRYISMADHSMAGLAKSLDAMRDACEMLLRQLDKATQLQVADETTGSDIEKVSSQQLARHLLEMIDASVSDHKFVVLESLSKLFSFVWNVGKSCIDDTENSPSVFLVDKYKTDHNAVEDGQSFTDCRVRSLQREVKNLQDKCSAFKEEVNNLNTREVHYRKEIKMLKDKTESQKTKIEDLKQRQTQQKKGEKECSVALNDDHENSSDSRSEDNDENQIINDLKEKNASLTQKLNSLENNAIAIKAMNEDQLKRKCEEIDNLKQEIEILKNKTQSISRSEADGESLTVDLEVLCSETYNKETNPKEETSTLKVDQVAPDTNKVLQCLEYKYLKRSEDFVENKIIKDLKEENVSLNQKLNSLENDALATEHINAEQLKRKCEETENRKQEIEILKKIKFIAV